MSPGLTSGTTRGTSGSIRQALGVVHHHRARLGGDGAEPLADAAAGGKKRKVDAGKRNRQPITSTGRACPRKGHGLAQGLLRGQGLEAPHREITLLQAGEHLLAHRAGGPRHRDLILTAHGRVAPYMCFGDSFLAGSARPYMLIN